MKPSMFVPWSAFTGRSENTGSWGPTGVRALLACYMKAALRRMFYGPADFLHMKRDTKKCPLFTHKPGRIQIFPKKL